MGSKIFDQRHSRNSEVSVLYSQGLTEKHSTFFKKKFLLLHARSLPKGVHVTVAAKITVIAKGCTHFCVNALPKGVQATVQSYSWRGIPSFNVCDLLIQSIKRGLFSDGWGDCSCDAEPITMGALKNKFPFNFLLLCKVLLVLMIFPILCAIHASTKYSLLPIKDGKSAVFLFWGCQISHESAPGHAWIFSRQCGSNSPTLRDIEWITMAQDTDLLTY